MQAQNEYLTTPQRKSPERLLYKQSQHKPPERLLYKQSQRKLSERLLQAISTQVPRTTAMHVTNVILPFFSSFVADFCSQTRCALKRKVVTNRAGIPTAWHRASKPAPA
jgi:hypothetical protein